MSKLDDLIEEYEFLEADDRYRLLIDLGKDLDDMPDALKTDATLVRGCSASVWVYPTQLDNGRLHFPRRQQCGDHQRDYRAGAGNGAGPVSQTTYWRPISLRRLEPFDLKNQLSSNRTQGIPNMIALIQQTAERFQSA